MAALSLSKLAEITESRLQGDANLLITGVSALDSAADGDISFATGRQYLAKLKQCEASAVILTADLAAQYDGNVLICQSPYLAYAQVVNAFFPDKVFTPNIHPSAVISLDAEIAASAHIAANVVIEAGVKIAEGVVIEAACVIGNDCIIGQNTHLHANVTLYSDTHIGEACRVHSGTVIGADGFGYAPTQGEWYKIKQVGNVVIGNAVEIGSNTCIDRAALGSTIISDGVKVDNLVQIAHNVTVGEHTAIAGCVAVAGSVTIGKRCQIGGTSSINGHITIADDVVITGMSMVVSSIASAGVYSSGMPANENRTWRKNITRFAQMDKMAKKLRELEQRIKDLSS